MFIAVSPIYINQNADTVCILGDHQGISGIYSCFWALTNLTSFQLVQDSV